MKSGKIFGRLWIIIFGSALHFQSNQLFDIATCQPCFIQVTACWKYKDTSDCQGILKSYFAWNEDIPTAITQFSSIYNNNITHSINIFSSVSCTNRKSINNYFKTI